MVHLGGLEKMFVERWQTQCVCGLKKNSRFVCPETFRVVQVPQRQADCEKRVAFVRELESSFSRLIYSTALLRP